MVDKSRHHDTFGHAYVNYSKLNIVGPSFGTLWNTPHLVCFLRFLSQDADFFIKTTEIGRSA